MLDDESTIYLANPYTIQVLSTISDSLENVYFHKIYYNLVEVHEKYPTLSSMRCIHLSSMMYVSEQEAVKAALHYLDIMLLEQQKRLDTLTDELFPNQI